MGSTGRSWRLYEFIFTVTLLGSPPPHLGLLDKRKCDPDRHSPSAALLPSLLSLYFPLSLPPLLSSSCLLSFPSASSLFNTLCRDSFHQRKFMPCPTMYSGNEPYSCARCSLPLFVRTLSYLYLLLLPHPTSVKLLPSCVSF